MKTSSSKLINQSPIQMPDLIVYALARKTSEKLSTTTISRSNRLVQSSLIVITPKSKILPSIREKSPRTTLLEEFI